MITPGSNADREWAAGLMSSTDPWITLGRDLDQCLRICGDPQHVLFVAREGAQPVGFILAHPTGLAGSPYIRSVAIVESARGKRLGTALVAFAEDYFRPQFRHIFLCVSSFNERARKLYERLGYDVIGELKEYIIPGASEILMHKRLRP